MTNEAGATGLSGGSVGVFGFNPAFGPDVNAAIVFDSSCPPGGVPSDCSGGNDFDLGTPNETFGGPGVGLGGEQGMPFENDTPLSNVAIVAEDLVDANNDGNVDDPDDADLQGQSIAFDFTSLNGGNSVTVNSIRYVDNDEGEFNAEIQMFGPGTLNPSVVGLPAVGDNGVNNIVLGVERVENMVVVLNGSGAVDSIIFDEELVRDCWVTTGGFDKGELTDAAGQKICTFGGKHRSTVIGEPSK